MYFKVVYLCSVKKLFGFLSMEMWLLFILLRSLLDIFAEWDLRSRLQQTHEHVFSATDDTGCAVPPSPGAHISPLKVRHCTRCVRPNVFYFSTAVNDVIPSQWCENRRDLKQKRTLKWHQKKWDVDRCDLSLFHPNIYSVYHTTFLSPFSSRNFKSWTMQTKYFSAAISRLIHVSLLIKQQCITVNILHNVRFVAQLIVQ